VSRFLVLDSGPLGLLTHPQRNAEVVAITEWLSRCLLSGHRIIIPAIVYYLDYAHNQRFGRWSLFNDAMRV
jgi:hypothetical protein